MHAAQKKSIFVNKYCDEYVCLPRGYLWNYTRNLYQFLLMLPMSVARSSSGMLMIGRIAYRREGVTGMHSAGSVIYNFCSIQLFKTCQLCV